MARNRQEQKRQGAVRMAARMREIEPKLVKHAVIPGDLGLDGRAWRNTLAAKTVHLQGQSGCLVTKIACSTWAPVPARVA